MTTADRLVYDAPPPTRQRQVSETVKLTKMGGVD